MQEEHRRAIQSNFVSLVEQTDLDTITSVLFEKGVFSEPMIEPYRDINKDVRSRKRQLYRDIERRGPNAFRLLLESLQETGHWDLVRSLDPDSVLHPRKDILAPHTRRNPGSPADKEFVSLSKTKDPKSEVRTEVKPKEPDHPINQQPPTTSNMPYPLDFNSPTENLAEIPDFHVIKSTQFHEQNEDGIELYPTRSRRRGVLIAFSFIEFMYNIEKYRKGADVDCTNLKYLFQEIGLRPIFYSNLTRDETESTLEALKSQWDLERGRCDCVFVVVSSHGYERARSSDTDIRCTDGQLISISYIVEQFNNKNFPRLRGVPKVFIFQSCRGTNEEHTWSPPRPLSPRRGERDGAPRGGAGPAGGGARQRRAQPTGGSPPAHLLQPDRLYSDILIAHSTLPGFVSRRDPEKGSWYVQALCEVFAARAHNAHMEQLFTLVDKQLHARFKSQTSSVDNWGFNKRLYLHPGLFDD